MNRKDWEEQTYDFDLAPTAKLIALVVGSFGNWTDERTVWPSTTAVADMAGTTRDTAQKYIDAFVEQGWLTYIKTREKNVKEYGLTKAVAEPFGILAPVKRGKQFTKKEKQLTNEAEAVAEWSTGQLPNGAVPVAESVDTNLKEPTTKEPKEEPTTTVADAPVDNKDLDLGEPATSPKSESREEPGTSPKDRYSFKFRNDPDLSKLRGPDPVYVVDIAGLEDTPESVVRTVEDKPFEDRTGQDWRDIQKQRPLTQDEKDFRNAKATKLNARKRAEEEDKSNDVW
jgi:hypothetical protein